MRVHSRGNLTVELIRMQRFEVPSLAQPRPHHEPSVAACNDHVPIDEPQRCQADRVQFSREALPADSWASPVGRDEPDAWQVEPKSPLPEPIELEPEPRPITPVIGSPALSGLGTALIVPGTLLDVVA